MELGSLSQMRRVKLETQISQRRRMRMRKIGRIWNDINLIKMYNIFCYILHFPVNFHVFKVYIYQIDYYMCIATKKTEEKSQEFKKFSCINNCDIGGCVT